MAIGAWARWARTRPAAARQPRGSSRRAWAASACAAHGASNAPASVHARPRPPPHRPPTNRPGHAHPTHVAHRAALGREPLASPAAPADGPGPHQHLRLTARRTPLRASAADHARRRTDRRRVGSACAPSIGTSKCPHPAGGCSPAPRRQRASLVSCGTFGSRSSRWIPRHPATSSDTRAMRIVRGSRGGRQCAQAAAGTHLACHGRRWTVQAATRLPWTPTTTPAHLERARASSPDALPCGSGLLRFLLSSACRGSRRPTSPSARPCERG